VAAVASAAVTLLGFTRPAMGPMQSRDDLAVWRQAFAFTYGAELRAERGARAGSIVDADPERYRRLAAATDIPETTDAQTLRAALKAWRKRQRSGKRLSIVRLFKASFTFAGGIDYLAWKINRHAGTEIRIAPWQRRWPLLGALTLLPRLLARGAVR
jgi:hypothetical protein